MNHKNPWTHDIREEHDPVSGQMVMVLTYTGSSPAQSIRIPTTEALQIMMEYLDGYAGSFPSALKAISAYPQFAARMEWLRGQK